MLCPHCAATAAAEQPKRTILGYHTVRCPQCRRTCNEGTGTPFKHRQVSTDLVLLVVRWRLRDKLRLRDRTGLFLDRGFVFSHEAIRAWEARCAPFLADRLWAKRRSTAASKWHADETYVRFNDTWCSRYSALDRGGISSTRCAASSATGPPPGAASPRPRLSGASAKKPAESGGVFWRGASLPAARIRVANLADASLSAGGAPEQVTTDRHDAHPRAPRETLGSRVQHRTSRYKNNRIEQDHRGVKQRYYPLRGFGRVVSAARCCTAFEEQRQYFRARGRLGKPVSPAERRRRFQERRATVMAELAAA